MMNKLLILTILAMVTGARAQSVFSQEQILDFYGQPAAPANPPTNYGRVYYDTATSQMKCLNSDGTNCLSSAGTGTVTSIATTSPITGGTITSTGTIACATCVTSAASLTSGAIVLGAGLQATSTSANFTTSGAQLNIGAVGAQGILGLVGTTSGTATITGPATAGTTTNGIIFSNVIQVADGAAASSVGFGFSGATQTGLDRISGNGNMRLVRNGSEMLEVNSSGLGLTNVSFQFCSSGFASCDTNLSKITTNTLGVGTGAVGNAGGTLNAAAYAIVDGSFGSKNTETVNACETAFATTTLATGATTTNTGLNCLPGNSIIDAVVARVTTTITASCTGWSLGDASTAARFASNNTTLTSGTTTDATHIGSYNNTGIASATTGIWQATAAPVKVTCAGGNPGAGAIRIIVYSHTPTAPTS